MIFHQKLLLKYDTCIHAHTCIHAYEYICKVCKGYVWKDIQENRLVFMSFKWAKKS